MGRAMNDLDAVMLRSARERGPRWACRTLEAIGQARLTLPSTRPLQGRTAVVLGAGPSLDLAGPHLEQWQREGAYLISTNTAARACVAHGVQPDMLCLAETDPIVSSHMQGVSPGLLVLSTYASQEAIDAALEVGPVAFAVGPEPATMALALRLGIPPLWYSGCVAVMAVAIARHLGAARVVLAGVDAAYTDRMYAKHTPFEDLYPHVQDSFQTSNGVLPDLVITLSDLPTPSKKRTPAPALYVENNAGGESLTEAQLLAPCELFVPAGKGCTMHTISPHGARIEGIDFVEARYVDPGSWETRASVQPAAVSSTAARVELETYDRELRAWDPHETVYAPPSVPLATYWANARDSNPLRKLEQQRATMMQAKGAMLEAVTAGLGRCTP
jgi:hypothetical protein